MNARRRTARTAAPAAPTNAIRITVSAPASRHGTPQPQAKFFFPVGASPFGGRGGAWPARMARTVMHLAAARLEMHSDENEGWSVAVHTGMNLEGKGALSATITIELVEGDQEETARATRLLHAAAETFNGASYDGVRGGILDSEGNSLL